jgi:hypothetical protein
MNITMSQYELKAMLAALETASHVLGEISDQCPRKIKRNKVAKINVGGGKRWWKNASDRMMVMREQLLPFKVSQRHKVVRLTPPPGLGEGLPQIEIDKGVAPLIQALWKKEVRTYECCQGGYDGEEGSKNARGFVIVHANDYLKAKLILTKYLHKFKMEKGTGGYVPSEYNTSVTKDDRFVYVSWKPR